MDGEKFRNNIKKQVIILKFFKDQILKIIIINQNEIKNKNTWKNFVQIYLLKIHRFMRQQKSVNLQ